LLRWSISIKHLIVYLSWQINNHVGQLKRQNKQKFIFFLLFDSIISFCLMYTWNLYIGLCLCFIHFLIMSGNSSVKKKNHSAKSIKYLNVLLDFIWDWISWDYFPYFSFILISIKYKKETNNNSNKNTRLSCDFVNIKASISNNGLDECYSKLTSGQNHFYEYLFNTEILVFHLIFVCILNDSYLLE